jgi:glycosyltransferase involved in cell wall biosynthesis
MPDSANTREEFISLKICVIIPTYNNASTLSAVIRDVAHYTNNIIVVNDGSTDNTLAVLDSFPDIQCISYQKNVGKGWALRKGFALAVQSGFEYAITFDADGQHFANDLPLFVESLQADGPAIIMGARNLQQENMPAKNSFGNKFSNFWFWVETGIRCPDTQTGYRLYPVAAMKHFRFYTRKYEFEIEAVVRSVWKGIKLRWIPVSVYYAPKETRITHFRPFWDFFRISILNTVLVLFALLYVRPRDFFRSLFKRNWKETLKDHLFNPNQSDAVKAQSVGFGIFMGIIPIWGFQLLLAIALSIVLRLNKALVIVAANISVPPMIPLLVFLSYKTGTFWVPQHAVDVHYSKSINRQTISLNLLQYLYGSITLAIVAGILFGLLTFILLRIFKRKANPVA